MKPYDYTHRNGVEDITWERFSAFAGKLAEDLAAGGVQAVIGVARAGLFPATAVACALRCEFYPVRLTRRVNDLVTYEKPVWKVDVSPEVASQVVAVVDDIADTGETLALVAARAREMGAARLVTASLVAHPWANPMPDHVALLTDALVLFPWDRQVYQDGRWQPHPELEQALRLQRKEE